MMRRIAFALLLAVAALLPVREAWALCPSIPFTFSNGTLADASQVNQNFSNLENCANGGQITTLGTVTSGVWQGTPIAGAYGGVGVLLQTINASSSATVDFTTNISATYRKYLVVIHNLVPATDNVYLQMEVGTGGTPTWQNGASAYAYGYRLQGPNGGADGGSQLDNDSTTIHLTRPANGIANAGGLIGSIFMADPTSASLQKFMDYSITYNQTGGIGLGSTKGGAFYGSNTPVTGLRFFVSSGNITSGTFELWGLN